MKLLCLAFMAMLSLAYAAPQTKTGRNYDFGFNAGSHFRREQKTADGKTRGEYGFRTPDGCLHVVTYEADQKGGYRVLGSGKRDCTVKTSTSRPAATTTTTKRPKTTTTTTTTTTTPATTPIFSRTTTSTTTTTTTTPKPRNPLFVNPLPQVDNAIEAQESQGRQLRKPNQTTRKPATTTTPKPDDKPEPLYSYGYTAPSHGHQETGSPDGSKKGEYYWDSPDGWRRIVTYVANEKGFFPKMSRVRIPTTTPKPPPGGDPEGDPIAKDLAGPDTAEEIAIPVGGCPYYFYYNTRMNYHWERCHENSNKTGEYGHLSSDGYSHKTSYYADATGFHPKVSRTPLTTKQSETVAEYTKGAFIIPKPDEERHQTEKRIQDWVNTNRDRVDTPLR